MGWRASSTNWCAPDVPLAPILLRIRPVEGLGELLDGVPRVGSWGGTRSVLSSASTTESFS